MAKIENEQTPDFGHDDFLQIGWRNSKVPTDTFEWDHLQNSLTLEERVRSKLREKFFKETKQWN